MLWASGTLKQSSRWPRRFGSYSRTAQKESPYYPLKQAVRPAQTCLGRLNGSEDSVSSDLF